MESTMDNKAMDNKYVIFNLDNEYYGITIESVVAIEKMENITRIPNSPNHIKGLINLRGDVITLISLREKINKEDKDIDLDSRIIVVSDDDVTLGLVVDSSSEVIEIDSDNIDSPPSTSENQSSNYISGVARVGDRLVILLDLSKILEN